MGGGLTAWKAANLAVVTGSKPDEAKAISKPAIKDQDLFKLLDGFMSTLPDGFLSLKADKVAEQLKAAKPPVLIDIRLPEERDNNGYIKDSINIPFNKLFTSLDKLPAKDAPFIIYCGSGHRGAVAIVGLQMLGYTKTLNMGGGLNGWKAANLPLEGVVDWASVWPDFLKNLPADFYTVKADMLFGQIKGGSAPFLVDLREAKEIETSGFIKGAVNIPIRNLLKNLDKFPAQDKPVVVYCGSGHRGGMAVSALRLLGYTDVRNIGGGFGAWTKANLEVEKGKLAEPKAGTAPKVDELRLKAFDKFLSTLPDGFYSMGAPDVKKALEATPAPVLLDVRTADEIKAGYIKGSVFIPINELLSDMKKLPSDKAAPIITVCQSGHRGAIAMMALRLLGYTNVNSLSKGINGWIAEKLPLEK
jgi:rhodanese-related sulfurtransferase